MIEINVDLCKGCSYCVKYCPRKILELGNERNKKGAFYPLISDAGKCTACAICARMCPESAIEVSSKEAE